MPEAAWFEVVDMSERWRKFRLHVVRFMFWITPSWLWRKFTLLMLRLIAWRNPSLMDSKMREAAKDGARKFGRPELEEELMEWQKNCLDKMLHPESDRIRQVRWNRSSI